MTAQELPSQNALAGEAGGAFAAAMDEAVAEGGLKGMTDVLYEGEPEKKDKEKPGLGLCLSNISALLMQGAYHIQQAADVADNQTLLSKSGQEPGDANQGQITGGCEANTAGTLGPEEILPKPDVSDELTAYKPEKGFTPQKTAMEEAAMARNAALGPVPMMAEEKNELDQPDFRTIQKPQTQSAAKTAQFMGVDSAREAVKPLSSDLADSVSNIRGMAFIKPDKEKGKTLQMPAADMVTAIKTEQALHADDAQSTRNEAQENTARDESAALQVARASVHALRRGMTEYRVRLSPEGLGEVEVTVVTKGKAVSLSMRTDNEMARGLILDHADELRAELNQQNYHVSGFSVEVGMNSGNGAGFFASGEHDGPAFDTGRMIPDQESSGEAANREPRPDPRLMLPRSSTISYRI